MVRKVELLAPAGGLEQLKAAVYNGADAVYFGGERFSARTKAVNFTIEDLIKARRITRKHGVKMYCAMNILMFDSELEEALNYVAQLEVIGIDALIIQDIGFLTLVREYFPDMEIHSSTQMSIQNHYGLELLKKIGVRRAVLPRESSLEDIKQLKDYGLEMEVFVHGAICICFSGQCLMSSMIGGRSGNRGACAQPCRLQYSLIDYRTKKNLGEYPSAILSPKDMMLINSIDDLIKAGVASFKIEGRMKTPEYVASIVKYYRKAIDCSLEGRAFSLSQEDINEIAQVFSRDFTDAYLKGESGGKLMNPKKTNNRGVLLGRVQDGHKGKATILLKSVLELGDRISIWTTKEGRINSSVDRIIKNGSLVSKAEAGDIVVLDIPKRVNRADRVFKIESSALKRNLLAQISEHETDEKIGLKVIVSGNAGENLTISFVDDDGFSVEVHSNMLLEKALKHPLEEKTFREQMRFGDTDFYLKTLKMEQGQVMVPKSILNTMRREGVGILQRQRESFYKFERINLIKKKARNEYENKGIISITVEDIEKLNIGLKAEVDFVCYPLMNFRNIGSNWKEFIEFLDSCDKKIRNKIVIEMPRIVREEEVPQVEAALDRLKPYISRYKSHTLDQIQMLKAFGVDYIHGDATLNVLNSYSYEFFKNKIGIVDLEYSRELNLIQLEVLDKGGQLAVFGIQELMVLEHCILGSELGKGSCRKSIYALKDRKDIEFPILVDDLGKNHIFNGRILMLTEELEKLINLGFRNFGLSFILIEPKDMKDILNIYIGLIRGTLKSETGIKMLQSSVVNYTKGHYNRGVI